VIDACAVVSNGTKDWKATQWSSTWGSGQQPQQWFSTWGSDSRKINPRNDSLLISGLNKLAIVKINKVRTSIARIKNKFSPSSDHNLEAGGEAGWDKSCVQFHPELHPEHSHQSG